MTNFEKLKSMSVEELAEWLSEYLQFQDAPHDMWFTKTYCDNCEGIEEKCDSYYGLKCCRISYCEKNNKCVYFKELKEILDNLLTVKLWLNSEVDNKVN